MKRPRVIVGILVIVHLLLAVIAICYFEFRQTVDWIRYPLFMLLPSQGSLIAIWTALGKRTPCRVVLTGIGIIICLRVFNCHPHSEGIWMMTQFSAVQIVTLAVLLLVFRLTGLQMEHTSHESGKPKPLQFSIGQIMIWTATVAIIMSALHYFPKDLQPISPEIEVVLATAAGLGSVALMSMWLIFGKKWLFLRILAMLITIAIASGTWIFVVTVDGEWLRYVTLVCIEAIWTILSLLVIRWAGYQMTWHWRLRRFEEPLEANAE